MAKPALSRGATEVDKEVVEPNTQDANVDVAGVATLAHEGREQPGLQRKLGARQLQMIVIGGTLGSGLFLGSGEALAQGGPVGTLLGYLIMGVIVWSTMIALGEMAALFPVPGAFVHYASRFLDPAIGFSVGWTYVYELAVVLPTEITGGSIVISYWDSETSEAVWIAMYIVVIAIINMLGVRVYGEVEYWLALIKVITAIGLIILNLVIALGGGPTHDRLGFRYWINPGAFAQYNDIAGPTGRFLAFWSVFVQAAFSFLGTEVVALTAAETKNPGRNLSIATKRVFIRIFLFYVGGIFTIGLTVPFNDPNLISGAGTGAASPFVIAIQRAQIQVLPSIVNAVILLSTFSAGSSYVYANSRTLYGLANDRQAPAIFRKCLKNGLPWPALIFCLSFGLLAFMNVNVSSETVFGWLYLISSITGILIWMAILASYLRFYAACKVQGVSRESFPYRAPLQPYLSWFGFIMLFLIVLFSGFGVFLSGSWNISDFLSAYISLPITFAFYIVWKFWKKTKWIPLAEIDLYSGRHTVMEEQAGEEAFYDNEKISFKRKLLNAVA